MKTAITFIIVFGVIVIVHEFGHFFFARKSGILVREFSIGMGPKLFAHQAKDGTTFTLRLLPLGGYVRMAGVGEDMDDLALGMPISVELNEDEVITKINTSKKVQLTNSVPLEVTSFDLEDALYIEGNIGGNEGEVKRYSVDHDATIIEEDGTEVRIAPRDVQFQSAKLWKRMLTNFAGPMNNFLLTIVLSIVFIFMQGGTYNTTNVVGVIADNSPAESAGLKDGDKIISVNGDKTSTWSEVTSAITSSSGKTLDLTVEHDGKNEQLKITPEKTGSGDDERYIIGISQSMSTSFGAKVKGGFEMAGSLSLQIITALKGLFSKFSLNKLAGPVGIFQMTSQASQGGATTVIWFMAMLSVNLGLVNLLPIPMFDGGKLVLNIIEGIRRKPLSPEKEGLITMVGVAFIFLLMILVTWNDIRRMFF